MSVIICISSQGELCGQEVSAGESRNTCRVILGKPEGNKPLGIPSHRWEIHINMAVKDIWWENVKRIYLVQNRDKWLATVTMVTNLKWGISCLAEELLASLEGP